MGKSNCVAQNEGGILSIHCHVVRVTERARGIPDDDIPPKFLPVKHDRMDTRHTRRTRSGTPERSTPEPNDQPIAGNSTEMNIPTNGSASAPEKRDQNLPALFPPSRQRYPPLHRSRRCRKFLKEREIYDVEIASHASSDSRKIPVPWKESMDKTLLKNIQFLGEFDKVAPGVDDYSDLIDQHMEVFIQALV